MHEAFLLATGPTAPVARLPFDLGIEEILSLIGDGVVSIDQQGRIILFNRAAEMLFGYTSEELLGSSIEVLIPTRFHDLHRHDVEGFIAASTPIHRPMGNGREVLGRHRNGREFPIEATLSRHVLAGRQIFIAVVRDVTDQKTAEQQRQLIAGEVAHRLRNTMAVVSSIVTLTGRRATSLPDFISSLSGRLAAVARTNNALIEEMSSNPGLRSLLLAELTAFHHDDVRFTLIGPDVQIGGKLALNLALIFHELATNAAKYGAFSTSGGEIEVDWYIATGAKPVLELSWRERGGPMVAAPTRSGFGSRLIGRILQNYDGTTRLTYDADGVCCAISVPLTGAGGKFS